MRARTNAHTHADGANAPAAYATATHCCPHTHRRLRPSVATSTFPRPASSVSRLQMINSASLAVVGLCLAMSSFSLGFSPLTYVVPTEVFPTRVRAKAMSLALFTTRLLAGVISLSFLSLQELLTPEGIWFVAAAIAGLSVVFVILYVPETKGRTLEEVEGVFRHRLQQSENRVYVKFDEFAAQTRRRVTNIQCTLV
eukprot:4109432-Pleurochrysis_carterae.AAC.1